jgi:hypothetical protein
MEKELVRHENLSDNENKLACLEISDTEAWDRKTLDVGPFLPPELGRPAGLVPPMGSSKTIREIFVKETGPGEPPLIRLPLDLDSPARLGFDWIIGRTSKNKDKRSVMNMEMAVEIEHIPGSGGG